MQYIANFVSAAQAHPVLAITLGCASVGFVAVGTIFVKGVVRDFRELGETLSKLT